MKLAKFKLNCSSEWEVDKWLYHPVPPFEMKKETVSLLRNRFKEREEAASVPFLSREEEWKAVCEAYRRLVQEHILPLAALKHRINEMIQ